MTEKSKDTKDTGAKDRSPRYPNISLPDAIKMAQTLYEKEKRAFVPREVAVKAWGYNKLHGRSLTILASVAQYGLLGRQRGNVGISEDAFTILVAPHHSKERVDAIERCAKAPTVFNEILQKHPDDLPSDDTLAWDLRKNGFTEQAAKTVIDCLRDTISFAKKELGDYNGVNEIEDKEQIYNLETPSMPLIAEKTAKMGGTTWNFPLLGKTASVSIVGGEPVQEDVDLLTKLLEAFKEGLSKRKVENNE
jgi:hypothetical protein